MIERLLENWLIRANERSFQIPFCHWLAYNNHTVVHLSRHCAMEMGKDVLAIAPDGVPCAYQLKGVEGGGRLTLSKWREDIAHQLFDLVHGRIVHPSIPGDRPHRAYVVINGELDEEVARSVDDFNRGNADRGQPDRRIEVIVRGQLFNAFKDLQSDFWVTNLGDLKTYLELQLETGRGLLPKDKLGSLFETALPFHSQENSPPSRNEIAKAVAGAAIICASAISSFTKLGNHLAEFEAWTLFWGYTLAIAERWMCQLPQVGFALEVAEMAMYSTLGRLCDELMVRDNFVEEDPLADRMLYEVRMTHLLGLMGIYALWRTHRIREGLEEDDSGRGEFLQRFCRTNFKSLWLWGEYAIPQFLAYNFYLRTIDATPRSDQVYRMIVDGILEMNGSHGRGKLANPYYDAEAIFPYLFGLESKPLRDSFGGSSYLLDAVTHLFTRANYKQQMQWTYPSLTKMAHRSYIPEHPWQFFFYRNRGGTNHEGFLQPPHSWRKLRELASESEGKELPESLRGFPIHYLCLICTLPHRANASGLRWVSTRLLDMGLR